MRTILLFLLGLSTAGCYSQTKPKQFEFRSVGWKISVPDSFPTEDSARYFGQLDKEIRGEKQRLVNAANPDTTADQLTTSDGQRNIGQAPVYSDRLYQLQAMHQSPKKLLLEIRSKGRWTLNNAYFHAEIRPVDRNKLTSEAAIEEVKKELRTMFGSEAIRDSSISEETVSGKQFRTEQFTLKAPNVLVHYRIYGKVIGTYYFTATFSWGQRAEEKEELLKIWKNSVFRK